MIRAGIAGAAALLIVGGLAGYRNYKLYVLANFDTVVEGKVYRSAAPNPNHLRSWKQQWGLQTVVCLRSEDKEGFAEERKVADELGLKMHVMNWYSPEPTPVAKIRWLIDVLEKSQGPLLIHCSAGEDRSGVASAIAAMKVGGADYETACRQIDPGRRAEAGSAGGTMGVLLQYEEFCRKNGLPTGGWAEFREWLKGIP